MTTTTLKPTVQQLRTQAGLSMQELATASKLSYSGVHQVEHGRYAGVNIVTARLIAEVFGLTIDDIEWNGIITIDGRPPLSGTPCNTGPINVPDVCRDCFTQKSASGTCAC